MNIKKILLLCLSVLSVLTLPAMLYSSQGLLDNKQVSEKAPGIQIPFIANEGQIENKHIRFYLQSPGMTSYITDKGEIFYSFIKDISDQKTYHSNVPLKILVLKETFLGEKFEHIRGEEKSITKVNYFDRKYPSKRNSSISTYNTLTLGELYEGIEVKLKVRGNRVEKLFYVKPFAKLENVALRIDGAQGAKINDQGELEVNTDFGVVRFTKPAALQEINGRMVELNAGYKLLGSNPHNPEVIYTFNVEEYDRTKELIIDPFISTYLGGTYNDYISCMALNNNQNLYVAGITESIDFPVTPGVYSTTYKTGVFISQFDKDLKSLITSTFTSFEEDSMVSSILTDNSGNVFIGGAYGSNVTDFREDPGFFFTATNYNGFRANTFVMKFDANLKSLLASITLNGLGDKEIVTSMDIDKNGNLYITGMTDSAFFPVTAGAYDTTYNGGGWDIFISKLDNNLENLLASTFLGGTSGPDVDDNDYVFDLSLDNSGNIFLTGATSSSDFPTTAGAYSTSHKSSTDVFVSKFDSNLQNLLASTFIGGSYKDYGTSHAFDSTGNLFVTGVTYSLDFPVTQGAYDSTYNGYEDVFIAKLDSNLSNLMSCSYIGGTDQYGGDVPFDTTSDSTGNIYIVGTTHSPDFPTTPWAYNKNLPSGHTAAFASKLDNNLVNMLSSTFLGKYDVPVNSNDRAYNILIDSSSNVYISGDCYGYFPSTPGTYDTSFNGEKDAFIIKTDSNLGGESSEGSSDSPPDLSGEWISMLQTCKTKQEGIQCKIKGKLRIQNNGGTHADSLSIRYYLSADGVYDSSDIYLNEVADLKVKSGKSKTKTFRYSFPAGQTATGQHIIALVDADNSVSETDESNNTAIYKFVE